MRVTLTFLCLISLAIPVFGQSNYAMVTGTIRDPQSLPVAKATIQFKALSTGAIRVVNSNDSGLFSASALPPDDYELTTEAAGFATVTQSLRLEVGQKVAIDIGLRVGLVKEGVHVNSSADALRPTDASVGEVIERKSVQELPLNGRMLIDLVLTVPGAHVGFGAQTGETNPLYWRPGQRSAIVIGGNRPNANFFLLDTGSGLRWRRNLRARRRPTIKSKKKRCPESPNIAVSISCRPFRNRLGSSRFLVVQIYIELKHECGSQQGDHCEPRGSALVAPFDL